MFAIRLENFQIQSKRTSRQYPFFSSNFSPIWLKSFDVLCCSGLKLVLNNFVITDLEI